MYIIIYLECLLRAKTGKYCTCAVGYNDFNNLVLPGR
jgi:hypothetical protein